MSAAVNTREGSVIAMERESVVVVMARILPRRAPPLATGYRAWRRRLGRQAVARRTYRVGLRTVQSDTSTRVLFSFGCTMRILVSNDDGYSAPGLEALVAALQGLGDLTVVAPETNHSGASNLSLIHI